MRTFTAAVGRRHVHLSVDLACSAPKALGVAALPNCFGQNPRCMKGRGLNSSGPSCREAMIWDL